MTAGGRGERLVLAVLVVATVATFAPVLRADFVAWDDDTLVYRNAALNPPTMAGVAGFWRDLNPLTNSVYALLATLPAPPPGTSLSPTLDPRAFHAANLLLHVLGVLVVWALLRALVGSPWAAGAGALLFGLHPVQVEPVAWVAGLKDVLAGFLSLVALWQYVRAVRTGNGRARVVASVAFVLALLAKSTAAVVPLLAWALDRWCLGSSTRASLRRLGPWLVAGAGWLVVAASMQATGARAAGSLVARPLVALDAVAFYLWALVAPVSLAPDYGRTPEVALARGPLETAALLAGFVAAGVAFARLRSPSLRAAVVLFLAALVPVLGLVPFLFQRYSTVADRYLYVAMLGPALALALFMVRRTGWLAWAVCLAVLGLLGAASAAQTRHWHDSAALFAHTLRTNPRSWMAHNNQGSLLLEQGRIDDAVAHYTAALRLWPGYAEAHYNLGNALLVQGRPEEAAARWTEALRHDPGLAQAHYNLGTLRLQQGRADEAIAHYTAALGVAPDYEAARAGLRLARDRLATPP